MGAFTATKLLFGLGFSEVFVGFGVISIAVSIGLRRPLGNLIATFVMMFSRHLAIGDKVQIFVDPTNSLTGKIVDRDAFSYMLQKEDGGKFKLPAGFLITRPITQINKTEIIAD